MILEALRVLLFGMLGIFLVMAIIYGVIVLLSRISARAARKAEAEVIPIDVEGATEVIEGIEPIDDEFGAGGFGDGYVIEQQYVVADGYESAEYGGDEYADDQYGDEAYGGEVVYEYEGDVEYAEPEYVEEEVEPEDLREVRAVQA